MSFSSAFSVPSPRPELDVEMDDAASDAATYGFSRIGTDESVKAARYLKQDSALLLRQVSAGSYAALSPAVLIPVPDLEDDLLLPFLPVPMAAPSSSSSAPSTPPACQSLFGDPFFSLRGQPRPDSAMPVTATPMPYLPTATAHPSQVSDATMVELDGDSALASLFAGMLQQSSAAYPVPLAQKRKTPGTDALGLPLTGIAVHSVVDPATQIVSPPPPPPPPPQEQGDKRRRTNHNAVERIRREAAAAAHAKLDWLTRPWYDAREAAAHASAASDKKRIRVGTANVPTKLEVMDRAAGYIQDLQAEVLQLRGLLGACQCQHGRR
jgi:hypothetical protein